MTQQERAENYLHDNLTPAERTAFERDLAGDAQLRRTLQMERDLQTTFGDPAVHDLRATLAKMDAQTTEQRSVRGRWTLRRIAAVVVVLLAVGVGLAVLLNTPSDADRFASYYAPYELNLDVRNDATPNRALTAYQSGDYATAYQLLNELVNAEPNNALYQFLRGQSALATEQLDVARQDFTTLEARDDHLFVEQSRWYLALTLYRTGETDEARRVLESIPEGTYRWVAARAWLEAMK